MKTNNNRRHPAGKGSRPDLTKVKQSEAKERQAYYDTLTVEQKIAKLDEKFGKGVGATKQREQFASSK